jgi:hypothetical protein
LVLTVSRGLASSSTDYTDPVWSDSQNLMFITFGRFGFSVGVAILMLLTLLSPAGELPASLSLALPACLPAFLSPPWR